MPGNRRSPVMSGDYRGLFAERIEQTDHVTDEVKQGVALDFRRPIAHAITAHVRRHRVKAGGRQRF